MPESALVTARYPTQDDGPYGGDQIQAAVLDLEPYTVPRFPGVNERDQAYARWVQQGGVMERGMTCMTRDSGMVWEWQDATTGWSRPWGQPWGVLPGGSVTIGSNGGGLTVPGTAFQSVAYAALGYLPKNRRLRLTGHAVWYTGSTTSGTVRWRISAYRNNLATDGPDLDMRIGGGYGDILHLHAEREIVTDQAGLWTANLYGMVVGGISPSFYRLLSDDVSRFLIEDVGPA